MKKKELRKLLSHFLKVNASVLALNTQENEEARKVAPTQMTALQAKLHYLRIIAELPSYGAKCFSTNIGVSLVIHIFLLVSSSNITVQCYSSWVSAG